MPTLADGGYPDYFSLLNANFNQTNERYFWLEVKEPWTNTHKPMSNISVKYVHANTINKKLSKISFRLSKSST